MFDGSVLVVCLPEGAVITALEGCKTRIRTHYEPTEAIMILCDLLLMFWVKAVFHI
jgi:hypothetical protein